MANNAYEDVKSFVSGPALHQSFSRIKTWTSGQITSAISTHNSSKTHVPVCSTAGTYKFLKGVANGAPTWSDIPTSSAINSNTNDTLATSAAVNALNNNLTSHTTYTALSPTWDSACSWDYKAAYQYGKIVYITARMTFANSGSGYKTIISNLPTSWLTKYEILPQYTTGTPLNSCLAYIGTNQTSILFTGQPGYVYWLNFFYICL